MTSKLRFRTTLAGAALAALVAVGCSTGKHEGKTRFGNNPIGPPTGATVELTVTPFATSPLPQLVGKGQHVTAFMFTLAAINTGTVDVNTLTFESRGGTTTAPLENTKFTAARLVEDVNADGAVDQAELTAAKVTPLNMTATPEKFSFFFNNPPLTLTTGQPKRFILLMLPDDAALVPGDAGKSVAAPIAAATDIVAFDSNFNLVTPTVATGQSFGDTSGEAVVGFTDHLTISEVRVVGASGSVSADYIELFNASPLPVDMSTVYLSNHTTVSLAESYFQLPTGDHFSHPQPGSAAAVTFTVQFPNGLLPAGQGVLVVMDALGFAAQNAIQPSFCLRNPATTGIPTLLVWDGATAGAGGTPNFVQGEVGTNVVLLKDGDNIHLFHWDGTSDRVVDIDVFTFGANGFEVDKSGESTDGPDADTTATAYVDETDPGIQQQAQPVQSPTATQSFHRVDFTEGAETRDANRGNGVVAGNGNQHDETSEDWVNTWQLKPATPGSVP